ncbi:MAG: leucyl aminopeptidase, partial [Nocardioidaceae bacterium]|nr:leucyl aminopeptidase [Nocardioidaceae bacterium]
MTSRERSSAGRPSLPAQVSPPDVALSDLLPGEITGVDVVALAVLPAPESSALLLGPGSAELSDELEVDLVGVAEAHGLSGAVGEVAAFPVPSGTKTNPDLRVVLLVGVGDA